MGNVISARLHRRVRRDFPDVHTAARVEVALRQLASDMANSLQDTERLLAAAVFTAEGDLGRLYVAVQEPDFRDLLVGGELAHEDWPAVLDEELGPPVP